MDSTKDNTLSDNLRQKGNNHFARSEYFEALTMYNEALRFAELNTKQLGLCYGNRSATFLKVKQYKACLENIELARKNQVPQEILPKLNQREIECKKLMVTSQEEQVWNDFFKLSYEPNHQFPYLANCLELKRHKDGVFLATNRDLKAGDIIAITEPFVQFPSDTNSYRCNFCLADKFMNFIPCSGCTKVMFCNKTCMEKALSEFHQFECSIFDNPEIGDLYTCILRVIMKCHSLFDGNKSEMEKFLTRSLKKVWTPFDFDLSNPSSLSSQKNIMLIQLCENQQIARRDINFNVVEIQRFRNRHPKLRDIVNPKIFSLSTYYTLGDVQRFKSIGGKALSTDNQSQGLYTVNYFGAAIDICSKLLLHSCAPNIKLHPYNGKIIWVVHYPIKANHWLTTAFNNMVFFYKSRSERLAEDLVGNILARCKCIACVGKWDVIYATDAAPLFIMRYSSEVAIQKFQEYSYCKKINEAAKPITEKVDEDVWLHISNLQWNIIQIGKASFWDKINPMGPDFFLKTEPII